MIRGMIEPRDRAERMPRWVKVFGVVSLVIVVALLVLVLVQGGHGPSRHGARALDALAAR